MIGDNPTLSQAQSDSLIEQLGPEGAGSTKTILQGRP